MQAIDLGKVEVCVKRVRQSFYLIFKDYGDPRGRIVVGLNDNTGYEPRWWSRTVYAHYFRGTITKHATYEEADYWLNRFCARMRMHREHFHLVTKFSTGLER